MKRKMLKLGILTEVVAVFAAGAVVYSHNQAALAALQLYYIQEMLAALLLFSIGFTVVTAVIFILFLLERGLDSALTWTGHCTIQTAQRLHREWVLVEQFGRKHFHHSEQPVHR
jgi:hypothetical protein